MVEESKNTLHFYINRKKEIRDLVVATIFVFVLLFLRDKLMNFELNPIRGSIIAITIVFLFFVIIHSIILLLRNKPSITVTETEIILYKLFGKLIIVKFSDIESFNILTTYHKGIPSSNQIVIELKKPSEKYSRTWFYKFLKLFGSKVANSQYGMLTNNLDIKSEELFKILKRRLKKHN